MENAKPSESAAVAHSVPAGRLEFWAMRIATGPASSRLLTNRGALPKTLAKSASKSWVARRTGAVSCALSTTVTDALTVMLGGCDVFV
jgi:hypothetical protein